MRVFGYHIHQCIDPWNGHNAPPWAVELAQMQLIVMIQNEIILAKLEARPPKLSPKDQAAFDEIWDIEAADKKKLAAALKT